MFANNPIARRALEPALARELERQNGAYTPSAARDRHLTALSSGDLGVVVTGQQVGLFGGPAYSLYKAATAIVLARRLGPSTVPVFWLQSEDHDADEVASCAVQGDDEQVRTVTLRPGGAERASMGERVLGPGVNEALAELQTTLADEARLGELSERIARHYHPAAGWAQAFGGLIAEIFAEDGLVVLDPRTDAMASLAAPVHRWAFEASEAIEAALAEGASSVAGRAAVAPRPDCALSFFHPQGPEGARYRPQRSADGWRVPGSGGAITTVALLERLEQQPRCFSTSALLRVVLQNEWLPTMAQVAGPGEARYLQQLPPLFTLRGLVAPAVVPRAQIVVTDARCRRTLHGLGVAAADLRSAEACLAELAGGDDGVTGGEVSAVLRDTFETQLAALRSGLEAIDPALLRAAERTRRHVEKGVTKLGQQIDRTRARRDAERVARVERVCRWLRPAGAPQERVFGFAQLAARFPLEQLRAGVLDAVAAHLDGVGAGEPSRLREVSL